jgi:hypothetical protein
MNVYAILLQTKHWSFLKIDKIEALEDAEVLFIDLPKYIGN